MKPFRDHSNLYNVRRKGYRNTGLAENVWQAISEALEVEGIDVEWCLQSVNKFLKGVAGGL